MSLPINTGRRYRSVITAATRRAHLAHYRHMAAQAVAHREAKEDAAITEYEALIERAKVTS